MYFYIVLTPGPKKVVESIKRILSLEELTEQELNKNGLLVKAEDEIEGDCICVVNLEESLYGHQAEVYPYGDIVEAEASFKSIAQRKFSNWEDYTSSDIEAVMDDGYETHSTGSLCIAWAI